MKKSTTHRGTLHRGVAITVAYIRGLFWIPVSRKLTKNVIKHFYGCKKYKFTHYPGFLPIERTKKSSAFQIVGSD